VVVVVVVMMMMMHDLNDDGYKTGKFQILIHNTSELE
jgi:hypothetical protein